MKASTRTAQATIRLAHIGARWLVPALAAACSPSGGTASGSPPSSAPTGDAGGEGAAPLPVDPGAAVRLQRSTAAVAELAELAGKLNEAAPLTAQQFAAKYPGPVTKTLSYDPEKSANLALLQQSKVPMTATELALFKDKGFVISDAKRFPTFAYGYETIYSSDLPVYVSADSILFALHRSYDKALEALESDLLTHDLDAMLQEMRAELAKKPRNESTRDADLYLAVALGLLHGQSAGPVAGADADQIETIRTQAAAHQGSAALTLFGVGRDYDYSQFSPRGHYTHSPALTQYFQASIWLGRTELRMIETLEDGSQVFRRRQFDAAMLLAALLNETATAHWKSINDTVTAFVGAQDNMTPQDTPALLAALGVTSLSEVAALGDDRIAQVLADQGFGTQLIASQIMMHGPAAVGTLPLNASFLLLGQRYAIDSHVLSNVVYDRTKAKRMMPSPLDVAFAALHNDQAGALLGTEVTRYDYASNLQDMRILSDAHGPSFWSANLYNLWLDSLRTLSPSADLSAPDRKGLPEIAATEAWGRRLLNTQLASWAELRHDTILYVKQSYTSGVACEFPDAYVDPYPAFFEKVSALASKGAELVSTLALSQNALGKDLTEYFHTLGTVSGTLGAMAQQERTGAAFTKEQLAFINRAVKIQNICGGGRVESGWYKDLFFASGAWAADAISFDPTIADVHTQPTDEGGAPVGKVLHVGTGSPRLLYVSIDTCSGPRAYVGVVSDYAEKVTENFQRLDDPTWANSIGMRNPDDVSWMTDLVAR